METQSKTFWLHSYGPDTLEQAKSERKFVLVDVFNPG